jgi:cobyrinic acid a,c-diamide synthase
MSFASVKLKGIDERRWRHMAAPLALLIAGTHSNVGKTTVSIAFMAALRRRGMHVRPFKVGPDFIDPTSHAIAAGCVGRNLDGWMLSPQANREIFQRSASQADVVIIEGVMGLFDGRDATTDAGSTAEMAKLLGVPTILIVDATAMARSAAAVTLGFEKFDPEYAPFGVIFNRVGGEGHFTYLRDAVAKYCASAPLGWLECDESVALPQRHLGLYMGDEVLSSAKLDALANWLERHVNLDEILNLAARRSWAFTPPPDSPESFSSRTCIGVARDPAFRFYYQDNLDLLEKFGARLEEFSPLSDDAPPKDADGLYFGGGYPELHAARLTQNSAMRDAVRRLALAGAPIYAECGGLMYLMEAIVDGDGNEHEMVGIFPMRATMQKRLAALGYAEVKTRTAAAWMREEMTVRGHEFHYSTRSEPSKPVMYGYDVFGHGDVRAEGFCMKRTLGSYLHLHFASCPAFAEQFVSACVEQRRRPKS